ncbi:sodium:proton antiporter [Eggerthellaceae bacterium zg-886]|uniref:Sodium:proton antiporter n=1 Tax=Xiamenia xianingshaonis TaxID=2682776 RepID=A0ABX0IJI1_9ACTN|nr:sodium:proton antiporter [Xiamenia xianingshaonis]
MKEASVKENTTKPIKFRHGLLALVFLAAVMAFCVVGLGTEPQMPLVIGCLLAGGLAMYLGFSWDDVLESMVKGIMDSMEAVLILMCIGMLVAAWIQSGTVPTLIYYGISVISPQLFLPVAFLGTLLVGIVLGSWGAAGTIGIAFIGIAAALDVPLGMAAGAIIAGAYVSEIASPLTDGPVLCAAVAGVGVFDMCRRFLPVVLGVCALSLGLYFGIGQMAGSNGGSAAASTAELMTALDSSYAIGPLTLIPLVVMIVCIAIQVPAIPAFLLGVALGLAEAVLLQGADFGVVLESCSAGVTSSTGFTSIDQLFSTGGIEEMLPTITIVILVMAYVGILQHTGLMDSLIEPITNKLKSYNSLLAGTVGSGALFNIVMPDQYPAIAMSCKMYGRAFEKHGTPGTVWSNICNSASGITSVLVPWNTCSIYMVTILGVTCLDYLPFAFFCYLYPIAVIVVGILFGGKLGWKNAESLVDDTQPENPTGSIQAV